MQQIRSRQRVADHGEVFTAVREVSAMCDLAEPELLQPCCTVMEPACGSGNFLAEILRRRLAAVQSAQPLTRIREGLAALSTLHGVDLLPDNVAECRRRLGQLWCSEMQTDAYTGLLSQMLTRQIRCADWLHEPDEGRYDVIIGNPPYQQQVNEPGKGLGAIPIYQHFVGKAMRMQPQKLVMIIPSRWFSGGVGLSGFRRQMLGCRHIRQIVDYTNSRDCFPGVDINGGICYFLYDAGYEGDCRFTNITGTDSSTSLRRLDEFDILIRRSEAVSILHKVRAAGEPTLDAPGGCSVQTPFGLLSTFCGAQQRSSPAQVEVVSSKGIQYADPEQITAGRALVGLWKPMLSKLTCEHAGNPDRNGSFRVLSRTQLLAPGQVCTQSYLTVCGFSGRGQAENALAYLRTRFVRFLLLQTIAGMNISARSFRFVPWPDFSVCWTDTMLFEKYGLTPEETALIERIVRPYAL